MSSGMMLSTGPTSSVSIGNYKGVMLCHRPFAGASGAAGKVGKSSTQGEGTFKCGTVETPLGENVKISEHQKVSEGRAKRRAIKILSSVRSANPPPPPTLHTDGRQNVEEELCP